MATGIPVLISASDENNIQKLRPVTFSRQDQASFDEMLLQKIVDLTPDILPIRDFYPAVTSVYSLGREIPVELGERQGFIDNLLVTNDGHLVLVETKLYRNPEAIRDAVIQTLEYGMAIHKMSFLELEARIRRAEKTGTQLRENESILDRITSMSDVFDDFEIVLERYQRTGEILLLVVADGIRASVERITQWMNEEMSGSTPIRFGLVELRFYEIADGSKIVVPKTLLKTKEISRHVVVVDIQNNSSAAAAASVTDQLSISGTLGAARPIKIAAPALTKNGLLSQVSPEIQPILKELFQQFESIGLVENTKTAGQLRYGVVSPNSGEFLPILYLDKNNIWATPTKRVFELVGSDVIFEFKKKMNPLASFWRHDQFEKVYTSSRGVKYLSIRDKIPDILNVLESFKRQISAALEDEYSKI
ncbi:hypothetical protein R2103_04975 [Nitrosomonas sp. Is24]|uniref:hypothetical protein n=1 Tax=Nitrosomonas sp. Is24 TaxID=3080533 RepID=UPI00294B3C9A|nr:hypothetical protein [Nitrosomonas sp. Is24]MDV6341120.1 hypothetical protein [Nitrosomonas sp. Is24]